MKRLTEFIEKIWSFAYIKWIILGIVLIFILIYQVFLMNIGVCFTDEPWQIINSMNYYEVPQALLSHVIGHGWGSVFGYSINSFRWLTFILNNLIVIVLLVPLYYESHNKLYVLAVGVIILLFHCISLWGWDTPNMLFWGASLVTFYMFIRTFQYKYLILCGAFNALFTLCRIPSLLCVPVELFVVVLMLGFKNINIKNFFKYSVILLGIYCITLLLVICLTFGAPTDYLNALTSAGSEEHNIGRLLSSYFYSSKTILGYVFSVLGVLLVSYIIDRRYKKFSFAISVIIFFFYFYLNRDINYFMRNYILDAMVIITICFAIIQSYIGAKKEENNKILIFGVLLVMYAVIPAAGSNTGLLKVANVALLPMLLLIIKKYNQIYDAKRYLLSVFLAAGLCTIINTSSYVYEDRGWRYIETKVDLPEITAYTTKDKASFLSDVTQQADIEIKNKENIMFVGDAHRFIFEYLYGERAPYTRNDFWLSLNSEAYAIPTQEYIKEKEKTVIFMLKNNVTEESQNNLTLTDSKIEELGFSIVSDTPKLRIFKKTKEYAR